jgi:hypothetical protein
VELLQLSALSGAQDLLREVESSIRAHNQLGKRLMEEALQKKKERQAASSHEKAASKPKGAKGKGRLDETDSESDDSDSTEMEEDEAHDPDFDIPKKSKQWKWWIKETENGKEWRGRQQGLITRRRDTLIMLHRVQLLLGDTYFNLEKVEKEKSFYDQAEKTRELLLGGITFLIGYKTDAKRYISKRKGSNQVYDTSSERARQDCVQKQRAGSD